MQGAEEGPGAVNAVWRTWFRAIATDNLQLALERPRRLGTVFRVCVHVYVHTHTHRTHPSYTYTRWCAVSAVATFWRANKSPSTCDRSERRRQAALIRRENTIHVASLVASACSSTTVRTDVAMSRRNSRLTLPRV